MGQRDEEPRRKFLHVQKILPSLSCSESLRSSPACAVHIVLTLLERRKGEFGQRAKKSISEKFQFLL